LSLLRGGLWLVVALLIWLYLGIRFVFVWAFDMFLSWLERLIHWLFDKN